MLVYLGVFCWVDIEILTTALIITRRMMASPTTPSTATIVIYCLDSPGPDSSTTRTANKSLTA